MYTLTDLFNLTSDYITDANNAAGEGANREIYNLCVKYHMNSGTTDKEDDKLLFFFNFGKLNSTGEAVAEEIDLFNYPEEIPEALNDIFVKHWGEYGDNITYSTLKAAHEECEAIGYTFDYYLDAVPFGLKKIKK